MEVIRRCTDLRNLLRLQLSEGDGNHQQTFHVQSVPHVSAVEGKFNRYDNIKVDIKKVGSKDAK
jgi:hypothetical protein